MALLPYVNFGGNCREAFTFYHEVFGGELEVMGFDDLPEGSDMPPNASGKVMHASLRWSDNDVLLGSDDPFNFGGVQGAMVNYTVSSLADAQRAFDALAEGGNVMMPFDKTFWSPGFGMLSDRFGTPWMINVTH